MANEKSNKDPRIKKVIKASLAVSAAKVSGNRTQIRRTETQFKKAVNAVTVKS